MIMGRSVTEGPIRETADGVAIQIQVLPRSSQCRLAGCQGGFLKIKITAPPVEGKANEECIRFLAHILGVKKDRVNIVIGHTSRKKTLTVEGLTKRDVAAILLT
jgi:uncharacterized protein (TIGR00251 family)